MCVDRERKKQKNQCFENEEGIKKKPMCFRVSVCVHKTTTTNKVEGKKRNDVEKCVAEKM